MNEEMKIKEKYFDGNTYIQAFTKKQVNKILEILYNIEQYGNENKGPDLISKTNNIIYGIEHFEFDCTKNDKNGSRYRQQIGVIDNKVNEDIKTKAKVKNTSILTLNQNMQNYIDSYKKAYNKHYSKINNYLEYLNNDFPNKEKEIWFFIEDVTPFGNHYLDKDYNPILFHPMLSEELIKLFDQSTQLKGILFATNSFGNEKKIFVYTKSTNEINALVKNCRNESVESLMIQNPLCVTTLIKVEKKELKDYE